ncbi:MAG TPA: hypothetical protein DCE71_07075, partial [Parachlamydiales bacterium]|nr:hypothetical protein [Parachlamydiales bacterium]
PSRIWASWQAAHATAGQKDMNSGQKGVSKKEGLSGFKYQMQQVKEGESFSILWKTLFVRLVFTYTVKPIPKGSKVSCSVEILGFFAWPVRWALKNKIRKNLSQALGAMVKQLENKKY